MLPEVRGAGSEIPRPSSFKVRKVFPTLCPEVLLAAGLAFSLCALWNPSPEEASSTGLPSDLSELGELRLGESVPPRERKVSPRKRKLSDWALKFRGLVDKSDSPHGLAHHDRVDWEH